MNLNWMILGWLFILMGCTRPTRNAEEYMRQYDRFILHQQSDSIADMYITDGELAFENGKPILGKDSIRKFLKSFAGAKVLKNESTQTFFEINGDTTILKGYYIQVVIVPQGDTLELGGKYISNWIKQKNGTWLIQKMYTHDYHDLKKERLQHP